ELTLGASLPRFTDVVPQPDDWFVAAIVFKAKHTDAGGTTEEHPSRGRRQAVPACGNHPDDVAAGKRQYVAGDAVYPLDEAVGSSCNVFGRFAPGATIAVEFPAGLVLQDVTGKRSLQVAVVPFDEVSIDFRYRSKAGQFTCLRSTLQGTGEHAD